MKAAGLEGPEEHGALEHFEYILRANFLYVKEVYELYGSDSLDKSDCFMREKARYPGH